MLGAPISDARSTGATKSRDVVVAAKSVRAMGARHHPTCATTGEGIANGHPARAP